MPADFVPPDEADAALDPAEIPQRSEPPRPFEFSRPEGPSYSVTGGYAVSASGAGATRQGDGCGTALLITPHMLQLHASSVSQTADRSPLPGVASHQSAL